MIVYKETSQYFQSSCLAVILACIDSRAVRSSGSSVTISLHSASFNSSSLIAENHSCNYKNGSRIDTLFFLKKKQKSAASGVRCSTEKIANQDTTVSFGCAVLVEIFAPTKNGYVSLAKNHRSLYQCTKESRLEVWGFEPRASRMQSERSTTELHPQMV